MKILVVYFSRTGTARTLATRLAALLGADLEAIDDRTSRTGLIGWLRCGYQGSAGKLVDLGPPVHEPGDYDLVVIGGPIWSRSVSSPVRSYLREHRHELPALGFFYTCGGTGNERAFAQMAEVAGQRPIATLAVRQDDLPTAAPAIERFAGELARARAA